MLTLETAKNPIFGDENHTVINLIVKFQEIPQELEFTATSYDPHDHGKNLYERAMNKEFGEILPYVALVKPDVVVHEPNALNIFK
jgi:hypothetical protein